MVRVREFIPANSLLHPYQITGGRCSMRRLVLVIAFLLIATLSFAQKQSTGEGDRSASPGANQASAPSMSNSSSSGASSAGRSSSGSFTPSSPGNSGGMPSHASTPGNGANPGGPARSNPPAGGASHTGNTGNAHSNARSNHNADAARGGAPAGDASRSKLPANTETPSNTTRDAHAQAANAADHGARSHSRWMFWKRDHPRAPNQNETAKRVNPQLQKPSPCKGENCKSPCGAGQSIGENGACIPAKPQVANLITCSNGVMVSDVNDCVPDSRPRTRQDCSSFESQLRAENQELENLRDRVQQICAKGPTTPECIQARNELQSAEAKQEMLRRQNPSCWSLNP